MRERRRAEFPIAEVRGETDDALAFGEQLVKHLRDEAEVDEAVHALRLEVQEVEEIHEILGEVQEVFAG